MGNSICSPSRATLLTGTHSHDFKVPHRDGPERVRWVYQRYLEDYLRCLLTLDREVGRVLDARMPLLRGENPTDWRRSLYYHYYEGPEGDHHAPRHEGVATTRYKLISFYEDNEWEFYDLESDPDERRNRIDDPEVVGLVTELKAELQQLRSHFGVPPNESIPRTQRRDMRTIGVRYGDAWE